MKTVLFCQNNYAFGILEPIKQELIDQGDDFIWFVKDTILKDFPYTNDPYTTRTEDLVTYKSDVIFVPGNEVPHYLNGVKTQIFHGLAGEKKGHFRMRHYFDLYLTQGPYFTNKFLELKVIHKDFDVIETGWPKLDVYGRDLDKYSDYKHDLLSKSFGEKVILYAPTFSPKLTSAPFLINEIEQLATNNDNVILLKFHPLMAQEWLDKYKVLAKNHKNIIYVEDKNIIKFLIISDILISDTSSVVYEFLLLNKPVITFNSISKHINWENALDYKNLKTLVDTNLTKDPYAKQRLFINQQYHPYNDGKSALRMIDAVKQYIRDNGVPKKRDISFLRRLKIKSIFGNPQNL